MEYQMKVLLKRYLMTFRPHPILYSQVAELNEVVVGTSFLSILPNLPHDGTPEGHIDNVVVEESYRRRGIGKALMEDAIHRAKSAGCWGVQLTSRLYREGAHRFYADLGFDQDTYGFTLDFTLKSQD